MLKAIENDLIAPILKPIRLERKIVRIRKMLNRLMRNPIRFQHIVISTRVLKTQHMIHKLDENNRLISEDDHEIIETVSELKGNITTRIETYQNKQVVHVFTDVNNDYLKPIKKSVHK